MDAVEIGVILAVVGTFAVIAVAAYKFIQVINGKDDIFGS